MRIDVLAGFNGGGADNRVHMVGRADRNGVDFVHHFVVHIAIVDERFCVFEFLLLAVKGVVIDVAQRDDFAVIAGVGNVPAPFAADANAGNGYRFQRVSARLFAEIPGSDQETGASYCRRLDEIAACCFH